MRTRDRLYRTDAIVIARMDLGEADRIFTFLTPDHGKVRAVGKGVRKPTSRLGPELDYFRVVRLMLARGKDLAVITGVESARGPYDLGFDPERLSHAFHLVEITGRLVQEEESTPTIYASLIAALDLIGQGIDPRAVSRHFELSLLAQTGLRVELYRCVSCGANVTEQINYMSPGQGGILCPRCRSADAAARASSVAAQKYLRILDRSGLTTALTIRMDAELAQELEATMTAYVKAVSERDLLSLAVGRALRPS